MLWWGNPNLTESESRARTDREKDTLGRYAIDVAIEENLPYDEGMKEILDETAKTYGSDLLLHHVAHRWYFME